MSLTLLLPILAGCTDEIGDGAVWRYVWLTTPTSSIQIGGSDCSNIRSGTSHSVEGRTEFDYAAIYSLSADGTVHEDVFIEPDGAPATFNLNVDNGELARSYDLNRASFETDELLEDEIATHSADTVNIVHWFAEDCRDDTGPPPGFEPPVPAELQ